MKSISIKKSLFIVAFGIIASTFLVLTSCVKQKFDVPPVPKGLTSNITIADLKVWYLLNHGPVDTLKIKDTIVTTAGKIANPVIEGVISANDVSGNIYKSLYIQDISGGISISLDQASLFAIYPVGQKIFIKLSGLYMGTYGTAIQIGAIYSGKIGRIAATLIPSYLFPEGLPGDQPDPVSFNAASLPDLSKLTSLLVSIKGVKFKDAGQQFAPGTASSSHSVSDSTGHEITSPVLIIYTSNYANFSLSKIPSGVGTLQGILTVYGTKYEMLIRDSTDLINFH